MVILDHWSAGLKRDNSGDISGCNVRSLSGGSEILSVTNVKAFLIGASLFSIFKILTGFVNGCGDLRQNRVCIMFSYCDE